MPFLINGFCEKWKTNRCKKHPEPCRKTVSWLSGEAMLERLIEDTAQNLDLPSGRIEQLSGLLIALIFDRRYGGFAGFSASFKKPGMQDIFASWSSAGYNQSITFGEARDIFGVPLIAAMGCKLDRKSVV